MKLLRGWGIGQLHDVKDINNSINFSGYSILYSATDFIHLMIFDNEVHLQPETFYFIPPNSTVQVYGHSVNAVLIWFNVDLFVDRLEFLSQIKKGVFFRDPMGLMVRNTFMPYAGILETYYLPTQQGRINKLFARNLLINFIEFLLLRTLAEQDPLLINYKKDSYEWEITNRFIFLIHQDSQLNNKVSFYAEHLCISKRTLDNALQTVFGCSTKQFLIAKALEKAKKLLRGTEITVKNISNELGFSEESNFSNFFKKHTGQSPKQFRDHAEGMIPTLRVLV
ncbi:MAG: helix-turn-helix domain-containing protein [Weeksellaceae bacterium]|nr:helix-turn-helix domain-containing protein [Weeksellaceae bacterium]